ncbi:SDR family oxidoreductase [Actinotalea sp. C106]|uniref:SDR family NAD(P)-dependent oxidoreductase n=1 Tax=Actinotalea sp. C106 TaxID=2908644 RepID=UPI00202922FC|nr:SDR family NAD(P)-dependent oxidoreductase [Actinotalea sp. C106]
MTRIDFSHQTTLVTGASSGIGAALAAQLAARGSTLVLVARREDRLRELATRLHDAHGVRVETIALNLARPHPGRTLVEELSRRGLRVTSLVNNAGVGIDGAFHDQDPERLQALLALNVTALVDVTRALIDDLTAAGTGMLVNVTSSAAYQPIPGMAVYAASKTFVLNLTEALWWETQHTGLRTLAFAPTLTRTEFFDEIGVEQYPGSFQTPEEAATALLHAADRRRPGPSVTSRRRDTVTAALVRMLPRRAAVIGTARAAGSARLMGRRPAPPASAGVAPGR